ncbi:hypothetical protein AK812_SmicGene10410 [Symbiodinium microadriaticum]|uniref:Transmembrane protein n=1 Tax=Symbiodinium microadriaticum TaxID=2951 RepID=A0A1Q9EFT9_SYMMI|nr:hypothetical protein AK812_SmicGene10410 [Symbiodinium microadriaticum]
MKRGCGNSGAWEEVRLPVSTMLYSQAWPICDDSVDEDEQEFHLCAACIRRSSQEMEDRPASRIVQSKLEKSLRLLKAPGAAVTHRCERSESGSTPSASREELLEAAAARGLDGVLFPGGALALLAPRLAVVDDDKQEGVMQQLISDMFTKILVLGSIALMIASEILFRIEELPSKQQGRLVEKLTRHFRLIRVLYMASLLSWLCSMLFSSVVKYPKLWWASLSWSAGGLVVLLLAWAWIYCMVRRTICGAGASSFDSIVSSASGESEDSHSGSC